MLPTQGTKAAGLNPVFSAESSNIITSEQKLGSLAGKEVTEMKDSRTKAEATELLKQGTKLSSSDVSELMKAGIIKDVVLQQGHGGTVLFKGIKEGHQLNKKETNVLIEIANRGSSSSSDEMVDNEIYGASGGPVATSRNRNESGSSAVTPKNTYLTAHNHVEFDEKPLPFDTSAKNERYRVNTGEAIYEEISVPDERFQQFSENVKAILKPGVTVSEKSYEKGEPIPAGTVVWQIKNAYEADTGKVGLKHLGQYHQFDSLEKAKGFLQFADEVESAGLRGEVTILSERPPKGYYTHLTVWPSKSEEGKIGGKLHGRMASASDIHSLYAHLKTDIKPTSK